jgi:hypothetical protein
MEVIIVHGKTKTMASCRKTHHSDLILIDIPFDKKLWGLPDLKDLKTLDFLFQF